MAKLVETRNWKVNRKAGGRALRKLRNQRDATQDELAQATGISKTLISRLELGGTEKIDLEKGVKLWGALGHTPTHMAQDFGVYKLSTDRVNHPKAEEMRAQLALIAGSSQEEYEGLLDALLMTSQLYIEQYNMRMREKEKQTV